MMNSTQLRYFEAVAALGHFGRAAEALNISQPALSKSIQRLEEILGAKLFERTRGGLVMTPTGEVLTIHAKLVTTQLSRAHKEISELGDTIGGHVIVGAGAAVQDSILPTAISLLRARHPKVSFKIVTGHTDSLMPSLRQGDLDIVVSALPPRENDNNITYEIMFHDHLSAVARANHPLARLKSVNLSRLQKERWILSPEPTFARQWFDAKFTSRGLSRVSPAIEVNSVPVAISLLLKEDLMAFLPRQLYRQAEKEGLLASIQARDLLLWRPVGACYRMEGHLSSSTRALIATLRAICASPDRTART